MAAHGGKAAPKGDRVGIVNRSLCIWLLCFCTCILDYCNCAHFFAELSAQEVAMRGSSYGFRAELSVRRRIGKVETLPSVCGLAWIVFSVIGFPRHEFLCSFLWLFWHWLLSISCDVDLVFLRLWLI